MTIQEALNMLTEPTNRIFVCKEDVDMKRLRNIVSRLTESKRTSEYVEVTNTLGNIYNKLQENDACRITSEENTLLEKYQLKIEQKSLSEAIEEGEELSPRQKLRRVRKLGKMNGGAPIVFEGENEVIFAPENAEQICSLSNNTKWVFSLPEYAEEYFNIYTDRGIKIYVIRTRDGRKYIGDSDGRLFDVHDRQVNMNVLSPEAVDFLSGNINESLEEGAVGDFFKDRVDDVKSAFGKRYIVGTHNKDEDEPNQFGTGMNKHHENDEFKSFKRRTDRDKYLQKQRANQKAMDDYSKEYKSLNGGKSMSRKSAEHTLEMSRKYNAQKQQSDKQYDQDTFNRTYANGQTVRDYDNDAIIQAKNDRDARNAQREKDKENELKKLYR